MNVRINGAKTEAAGNGNSDGGEVAFERALAVAKRVAESAGNPPSGEGSNQDYRMATNNEVWPPVEKITIVDVPEKAKTEDGATDAVAYKADGDKEITVIRRDDNPNPIWHVLEPPCSGTEYPRRFFGNVNNA